jgi:hypothetical protein
MGGIRVCHYRFINMSKEEQKSKNMKFRAKRISHLYYVAQYKFKWWPFWFNVTHPGTNTSGWASSVSKFTTIDQVKSALQSFVRREIRPPKEKYNKEIVNIDLN